MVIEDECHCILWFRPLRVFICTCGGLVSVKLKIFVSWVLPFDTTSSSDIRVEYSGTSLRDANHFRAAA